MMLIAQVMRNTHDNDNEELSFITLGMAVRNVVRYLEGGEQQKENAQRNAEQEKEAEQKRQEQRAKIEQRLRDVAAFEDRFRPGYRSRRKRQ